VTEAADSLDAIREGSSETRVQRPSHQRLLGYAQALAAHDVPLDPDLVIFSAYDAESASAAVAEALEKHQFTALFCIDSVLTLGAYMHVAGMDITLPESFSFIGFDDQEWTTLVRPTITVVDQPRYRLGAATANTLIALIRGVQEVPNDMVLDAELVIRGSTSAPPGP
jgi:LacI family transcriptional regulator